MPGHKEGCVHLGQIYYKIFHNTWDPVSTFIHIEILCPLFGVHISRKYFKISKPQPDTENCYIQSPLLTRTHSSCTHQDSTGLLLGTLSRRCIIPSECAVPLLLPLSSAFFSLFSISPSGGQLLAPHWYRVSQPVNPGRTQPPLPSYHL